MATVLLLGLDDVSEDTIAKLLLQAGHTPRREALRTTWETRPTEDLIFVSGNQKSYTEIIQNLHTLRAAPPVVVISRLGDTSGWIEAMEVGAADFLAAPFTFHQISSVIEAAVSRSKTLTA